MPIPELQSAVKRSDEVNIVQRSEGLFWSMFIKEEDLLSRRDRLLFSLSQIRNYRGVKRRGDSVTGINKTSINQ
ncbi:MAG: hypothetical protein ACI92W_001284 [Paraglaciecola sp.]|jgi:hypothetical protein